MTNHDLSRILAEWFAKHDALKAYTNGFTAPIENQTHDWFLSAPYIPSTWVRNSRWAKSNLKPQFRKEIEPGIIYGAAFSRMQAKAAELLPEAKRLYDGMAAMKRELETIENGK